jgi:hypothetical protein
MSHSPTNQNRSSLHRQREIPKRGALIPDTIQVLQASVTALEPKHAYVLGLAGKPDGSGEFQPLASFMTNPAGSAIVNAIGPIRQIVQSKDQAPRRYLAIVPGIAGENALPVQVQVE